ncbi:MoaD/ThiS family protein [Nesterenkonia haasae]|uniref:MoaD/ThiS family protein n=1 Tax=Nesterenkonia haasae TaxID=2587813 RepID=UPI00139120A8
MSVVTVRLYAAAAEAAGTHQLNLRLAESPVPLQQLIDQLNHTVLASAPDPDRSSAPSLERVCAQSSFLVNGTRAPLSRGQVAVGDVVDVLPPFAGG